MVIKVLEFIFTYIAPLIGALIQALFLLLPVDFKNWEDDGLYVLGYVGMQGLIGGIIFIAAPWFLEVHTLSYATLVGVLVSICILAVLRALKIIPLEFTYPMTKSVIQEKRIIFDEFYSGSRYAVLADIPFDMADGELRYNEFRERLIRTRAEENETILEELISQEMPE